MLEPRHRLGAILACDAAAPRIAAAAAVVGDVEIEKRPTIVGADVPVGCGVMLHGCALEDDGFVGTRAIALNGAVVDSGALAAAGAPVVEGTRVLRGEARDGELDDMRAAARRYVVRAARHAALARPVGGQAR